MKKILLSLAAIGAVAAVVVAGTGAFFSDTETSTGNTFTAGAIDLTIDSEQHYNGNVCEDISTSGEPNYVWQGNAPYPVRGTLCNGTWLATNLGAEQKFFDFADVKPGDYGENTISLDIVNNDAWACMVVSNIANQDNGCNDPEQNDAGDQSCGIPGPGEGELQNALLFTMWKDDGGLVGSEGKCNNLPDDGEQFIFRDKTVRDRIIPLADSTTDTGPLIGGSRSCIGISWSLPLDTGNIVQTDSVTGNLGFTVEQARNNNNFTCQGDS